MIIRPEEHDCPGDEDQIAEEGDFEALTRRINGGLNGLESRLEDQRAAFEMLGQ